MSLNKALNNRGSQHTYRRRRCDLAQLSGTLIALGINLFPAQADRSRFCINKCVASFKGYFVSYNTNERNLQFLDLHYNIEHAVLT